jgi:hypothetical protein
MGFDGYIRVSDTKGRSGERFLSPDIQRDTIRQLAKTKGVELNEPIVEELGRAQPASVATTSRTSS